jgi:hypothetical protein
MLKHLWIKFMSLIFAGLLISCASMPMGSKKTGPAFIPQQIQTTGNADKAVFSQRARRPTLLALFSKPLMGQFMMDMHWIRPMTKKGLEPLG